MSLTGQLVGFDARLQAEALPTWPDERRRLHLLVLEAKTPLSVDPAVWPRAGDRTRSFLACGLSPSAAECMVARAVTIAVVWLPDAEGREAERATWARRLDEVDPSELDDRWTLLGFDVVDVSGFSALTNTGFGSPAFAKRIEDVREDVDVRTHLLTKRAAAQRYRDVADELVREHAPYAVVALYALRSTWTEQTGG